VLSLHAQLIFKFSACLDQEKNKYRVSATSLKSVTYWKKFSESCIKFLVPAFPSSHESIFSSILMVGFLKQFSGLQSQAGVGTIFRVPGGYR
jgi:hypothetical protein